MYKRQPCEIIPKGIVGGAVSGVQIFLSCVAGDIRDVYKRQEYIKDVQRYIRWSRAKVVATRELSDHINDQYDALRENGLNQKEACLLYTSHGIMMKSTLSLRN